MKVKRYAHGDMTDLTLPLYEQQEKETSVAYAAFRVYLELGDDVRSIPKVAERLAKSGSLVNRWCGRWHWVNRVKAWNLKQTREAEAALRTQMQSSAKEWAKREQSLREGEWQMAEALMAKVNQMLQMPIIRQTQTQEQFSEDGKTVIRNVTIVEPVKFDFGTAGGLIAQVSKLRRLATGVETDRVQTTVDTNGSQPAQVVIMLPDNGRPMQPGAIRVAGSPKTAPASPEAAPEAALPAPEAPSTPKEA